MAGTARSTFIGGTLPHPNQQYPPLLLLGHYVAHDNNRDAMALTLKLTRNILNTYLGWKAQVIHDLHESVPYCMTNTVGDEPYKRLAGSNIDQRMQIIGWNNVSEMTKFGMPGVFTHGTFDTWSPGYLMFIAASHNGISRLYELSATTARIRWSGPCRLRRFPVPGIARIRPYRRCHGHRRNNNNYEQTGLLVSLHHFADNGQMFSKTFI